MKNSTATTPNYQVTTETVSVVKNIALEGVKTLKAERVTTTFKVTRELHSKTNQPIKVVDKVQLNQAVKPMSYNLIEVTPEELNEYRNRGISSFVLKVDGKLYYTRIPDNINFVSSTILGTHRCAVAGHECNRLSAASDAQGGCAKVRDRSQHIERYSWITTGYETFNTLHDSFVVVNCSHYEPCIPNPKVPCKERQKAKLGLAQHLWEDVTDYEQVKKRVKQNIEKHGTIY